MSSGVTKSLPDIPAIALAAVSIAREALGYAPRKMDLLFRVSWTSVAMKVISFSST